MQKASILAHRGRWRSLSEQNTREALFGALSAGFGIETDLRDLDGRVVIAHDPPVSTRAPLAFADLLEFYVETSCECWLALNVKSDGLAKELSDMLGARGIERYFFFDMSVPETLSYIKNGLTIFTRSSEYEATPAFFSESAGIWIDDFSGDFDQLEVAATLVSQNKRFAIVSPELHRRGHAAAWQKYRRLAATAGDLFMICTDYPEEAALFMGVNDAND